MNALHPIITKTSCFNISKDVQSDCWLYGGACAEKLNLSNVVTLRRIIVSWNALKTALEVHGFSLTCR